MSSDFLTVATVDYTPQALATLRSARRTGNHKAYYYFVLDATPQSLVALRKMLGADADWIKLFGPHDLATGRDIYLAAFAYFNAFELSCLSKYFAADHVIRQPDAADICIYADADLLFLEDLTPALAEIGAHAGLVTPHQLGPAPDVDEVEHLGLGWLNAGFFCVRSGHPQITHILDWLCDRIGRRGFNAPNNGLFVDQVWLSAALFSFPNQFWVSAHPGLNVAYWNIAERKLSQRDGRFMAGDKPLLFFHFSGFEPSRKDSLSKHYSVPVAPGSVLDTLCAAYRAALADAAVPGAATLERIPCSRAPLKQRIEMGRARRGLEPLGPYQAMDLLSRIRRRVRRRS